MPGPGARRPKAQRSKAPYAPQGCGGRPGYGHLSTTRMLKKSIHGFFNYGLAEVNSAKPHKLLDFSSLAIWQSIHGLHSRVFFNTLLLDKERELEVRPVVRSEE